MHNEQRVWRETDSPAGFDGSALGAGGAGGGCASTLDMDSMDSAANKPANAAPENKFGRHGDSLADFLADLTVERQCAL